jgi:hypothetical protein
VSSHPPDWPRIREVVRVVHAVPAGGIRRLAEGVVLMLELPAGGHGHPGHVHAQRGQEWRPGLITVSWSMCDCAPALAACTGGPAGHLAVYCEASPAAGRCGTGRGAST